jgi:hypothetical protein
MSIKYIKIYLIIKNFLIDFMYLINYHYYKEVRLRNLIV